MLWTDLCRYKQGPWAESPSRLETSKTSRTRYLRSPCLFMISWFADPKPWPKSPKGCRVDMKLLLRNYSRKTYCFTKVYLIGQIFITFQGVQLTFNFIICYDIILCLEEIFKDLFSPCSVEKVLLINNFTITRWSYYERAFQKGSLRNFSAA